MTPSRSHRLLAPLLSPLLVLVRGLTLNITVDLGDAIEAMQTEATVLAHTHDGSGSRNGSKLAQANTHQSADTDTGPTSLHHTLGTGANQGAAGNHTHTQATSHNSPDTDSATSSLHHTVGTGANQAAAGNHVHAHQLNVYFTSSGTFVKASYPGLYGVEVECIGAGGGSGGVAATDSGHISFTTGGGGGGYAKAFILATDLLTSEAVTVGTGGAAGGFDTGGSNGGSSSFGAHFSVGGGGGGEAHGPFGTVLKGLTLVVVCRERLVGPTTSASRERRVGPLDMLRDTLPRHLV